MPNWIRACATTDIEVEDLVRFDHGKLTFIIVRSEDDTFHALDGICSHEHVHLCDGLVMDGGVECPKHNATFDFRTGGRSASVWRWQTTEATWRCSIWPWIANFGDAIWSA